MSMNKTILATAIAMLSSISSGVFAQQSAWDKFIDDSSMDIKARTSGINMSPNNVDIDSTYTPTMATGILFATGANDAFFPGMDPAQVAGILASDPATLAAVTQGINDTLEQQVKDSGTVNQGGASLWAEFKSGYLFDVIGFDFGYQGGVKTWNDGEGTLILRPEDDNYHRVSTANVKLRFGDDDTHLAGRYGRGVIERMHFGRDAQEYLLDKTYDGAEAAAQWNGLSLYALNITGIGEVLDSEIKEAEDFPHFSKAGFDSTYSYGLEFNSDYGSVHAATTWSDNYMRTTSVMANTGLPISLLGADVPEEQMLDYLLLFQVNYNWQTAEDDFVTPYMVSMPDHDSTAYEVMVGAQFDALFFAGSINQIGDNGFYDSGIGSGGVSDNLVGWSLINDFDLPGQRTYTFVASYNGKNFNLPGLELSTIVLHSTDINMDNVLASGNLEYYLTGETEFTETLFEIRYKVQEGIFKGLSFRGVTGYESNQANLTGYAGWIEYNTALF